MTGVFSHLPILAVVLPLLAAPISSLLHASRVAWTVVLVASILGLATAAALFAAVYPGGMIVYNLGGWAMPVGIGLRIDTLSASFLLLLFGVSTLALIFDNARGPGKDLSNTHLFYTTWTLLLTGFAGIVVSADLFNIFVFLEISSLAGYILIASRRTGPATRAALNYLFFGSVGAAFYLIGVGMLFIASGGLALGYIAEYIATNGTAGLIWAGTAFLFVGIAIKAALFPLHGWLPAAYTHAPDTATVFIAATSIKVALYILFRVYEEVLLPGISAVQPMITTVLVTMAGAAIIVGSTLAIRQRDAKTLLAFSSVAHVGYIVMGLAFLDQRALTGAVLHIFHHGLAKGALFLAVGAVACQLGSTKISAMAGAARRMPLTFAGLVVAGFGLVGVPLTGGFLSKMFLILGAMPAGPAGWIAIACIAIGSVLALFYLWRLLEPAYFGESEQTAELHEAPLTVLVPLWIMVGLTIGLGVLPAMGLDIASDIASSLLTHGGGAS